MASKGTVMGKKHHKQRGFTLIEVAAVLIIGGILLGTTTAMLLTYTKKTQISTTQKRLAAIDEALQLHLSLNGRYPCVADPAAALDSADFGREFVDCSTAPGANPQNGRGGRDVRIGAVPTRTLNLPDEYAADSWGGRFTFAITTALAQPNTYNRDQGGIHVVTSVNPPDLNDINHSAISVPGTAHYVIVSHGPNSSGARPVGGGAAAPCAAGTLETENCNGDAVFRRTLLTSTGNNATLFDDFVIARANSAFGNQIPGGAVMAFNLSACPEGWIQFNEATGRSIVGAGGSYNVGDQGGQENWTLTTAQMGYIIAPNYLNASALNNGSGTPYLRPGAAIAPHENRGPYHVLLYCQKT